METNSVTFRAADFAISGLDNSPPTIGIGAGPGGPALTITPDGRLIAGEGLSADEVTQALFDALAALWPAAARRWAEAQGA